MTEEEVLARVSAPLDDREPLLRILVVVAHPDDEVIAIGGRFPRFQNAIFLHVTDGAPADGRDAAYHGFESLDEYRRARRWELDSAFALAGIPAERDIEMLVPDQQAMLRLDAIASRIESLLRSERIEAVLTHPYEGGHPDHDACAFAVRQAASGIGGRHRPAIVESAFYHQGADGIETGCFLPSGTTSLVLERPLSKTEKDLKARLLECFPSQHEILQYFGTEFERFRIAPEYDFTKPPHPGKLFYEQFPWGITGKDFCALAQGALCR